MKINVNVVLKDLKGDDIRILDKVENPEFADSASTPGEPAFIEKKLPVTLRTCCVNALLAPLDGDKKMTGAEKFKLFKLAEKIEASDEVQISAEEISLLKNRIAQVYANLIVGRCFTLLEGE